MISALVIGYALVAVFLLGALIAIASNDPEANAPLLAWIVICCALWPLLLMMKVGKK